MPNNMKYDAVSSKAGAAQESKELSEKGPVDGRDETMNKKGSDKMGAAKGKMHMDKKGAAEYGGKKGDDSKSKKDYEGPGRSMGYTQNFGPARVNGYAKGAAKVNSIMGKGAAQGKTLDADAFAKFAISSGDDQQKSMLADQKRANLIESAGQFKDSLNLVKRGEGAIAKDMYGDKLQFGNVAGTVGGNSSLSATGVKPGASGAKHFGVDESAVQKKAGQSLLSAFRSSQDPN